MSLGEKPQVHAQCKDDSHSIEPESDPESDDAVTPKTPTVKKMVDHKLSDRSTDEEMMELDGEMSEAEDRDSPQYTSASSEDEEYHAPAPSGSRLIIKRMKD